MKEERPISDADRRFFPGQAGDILRGRDATLSGQVSGRPRPTVTWRLPSGRQLRRGESDGRVTVLNNDDLKIENAQPEDAGNYRIVASNSAGVDKVDIPVTVSGEWSRDGFLLEHTHYVFALL